MGISTVNGFINKEDFKKTYIHEHLYIDLSYVKGDEDTNLNDIEAIIDELRNSCIDSIVEVTNMGMGRNVEVLNYIGEKTGINIIPSTGFYKEPFLPKKIYGMDYKDIGKIMIKEITKGIDNTNIRAHVIGEVGTSKNEIKPMELKVLKASIYAHLETGHPIFTHTSLGTMALEQLDLFKKYKVNMSKVLIGHVDLKCNYDYHMQIADSGCYLGFDTIGKNNYEKDEIRIQHIKYLIQRGHLDQIVLSQDMTRKSHLKKYGGIGYNYLTKVFMPKAMSQGITKEQIAQMLIENPKRLLEI